MFCLGKLYRITANVGNTNYGNKKDSRDDKALNSTDGGSADPCVKIIVFSSESENTADKEARNDKNTADNERKKNKQHGNHNDRKRKGDNIRRRSRIDAVNEICKLGCEVDTKKSAELAYRVILKKVLKIRNLRLST